MVQVHSCRATASGTSLLRERQASLGARPLAVGLHKIQRCGAFPLQSLYTAVMLGTNHTDPALNDSASW